jgi:hypothetical protein
MGIIPLKDIRPELEKSGPLPREYVRIFTEARLAQREQRREAVWNELDRLIQEGWFSLTAVLNEEEPFRTFALEHLTHYEAGVRREGVSKHRLLSVTVKHLGAHPVHVCVDRREIFNDGSTKRYGRQHAPWNPGEELTLPVETAVGLLHQKGWFVKTHLPLRIRDKKRPLVEMQDGQPIASNGKLAEGGLPELDEQYHKDAEQAAQALAEQHVARDVQAAQRRVGGGKAQTEPAT